MFVSCESFYQLSASANLGEFDSLVSLCRQKEALGYDLFDLQKAMNELDNLKHQRGLTFAQNCILEKPSRYWFLFCDSMNIQSVSSLIDEEMIRAIDSNEKLQMKLGFSRFVLHYCYFESKEMLQKLMIIIDKQYEIFLSPDKNYSVMIKDWANWLKMIDEGAIDRMVQSGLTRPLSFEAFEKTNSFAGYLLFKSLKCVLEEELVLLDSASAEADEASLSNAQKTNELTQLDKIDILMRTFKEQMDQGVSIDVINKYSSEIFARKIKSHLFSKLNTLVKRRIQSLIGFILDHPDRCWPVLSSTQKFDCISSAFKQEYLDKLVGQDRRFYRKIAQVRALFKYLISYQTKAVQYVSNLIRFADRDYILVQADHSKVPKCIQEIINRLKAIDNHEEPTADHLNQFNQLTTSDQTEFLNFFQYENIRDKHPCRDDVVLDEQFAEKYPNLEKQINRFAEEIEKNKKQGLRHVTGVHSLKDHIKEFLLSENNSKKKAVMIEILSVPKSSWMLFSYCSTISLISWFFSVDDIQKIANDRSFYLKVLVCRRLISLIIVNKGVSKFIFDNFMQFIIKEYKKVDLTKLRKLPFDIRHLIPILHAIDRGEELSLEQKNLLVISSRTPKEVLKDFFTYSNINEKLSEFSIQTRNELIDQTLYDQMKNLIDFLQEKSKQGFNIKTSFTQFEKKLFYLFTVDSSSINFKNDFTRHSRIKKFLNRVLKRPDKYWPLVANCRNIEFLSSINPFYLDLLEEDELFYRKVVCIRRFLPQLMTKLNGMRNSLQNFFAFIHKGHLSIRADQLGTQNVIKELVSFLKSIENQEFVDDFLEFEIDPKELTEKTALFFREQYCPHKKHTKGSASSFSVLGVRKRLSAQETCKRQKSAESNSSAAL